ncbi:MAG TPA: MFS transporter [Saprospiraceae bacterium]|nr:MFS transporter [Saprospiraceae bacterium]
MKFLTRTIWILSLISLCTDIGSEMLYPVMPLYLKSIGFSVVLIGMLEGVAEATIGLSKGYFGKRSDLTGRRVPFIQLGYALSAMIRPMMTFFAHPVWVFFVRSTDRLGKGIRTGARDAMLSDESTPQTKGRVFGFHRSLDTLGAVIGPSIALLYLYFHPGAYKTMFKLAFIPGIVVILISFLLREKRKAPKATVGSGSFLSFLSYWKESPAIYRKVAGGILVFSLFNSSDFFLLLRMKDAGLPDENVIGVYIFFNLIFALCSFPLGMLGDKIGLRKTFMLGLFMFAIMYFGMAFKLDLIFYIFLFACYGVFGAATEGVSKAWISNLVDTKDTATAIGLFSGFQSLSLLLASSITGLIWYNFGPMPAFLLTAGIAVSVLVYFAVMRDKPSLVP